MISSYKKILVPVDGSKEAELALQRAVKIAKADDAIELIIANVIDTRAIQNITSFDNAMVETIAEDARQSLENYQKQAIAAGLTKVSYRIDYGSPKLMLADTLPKEVQADLIVIGATGLNTVERLVVGSVTAFVTRTAPIDVLVVRPKN